MARISDRLTILKSRLPGRGPACPHLAEARAATPRTSGCEECLAAGMRWVHLRLCLTCGHVGCCNASEGKHATAHFEETAHPLVRSHEPGETWCWCYVDQIQLDEA